MRLHSLAAATAAVALCASVQAQAQTTSHTEVTTRSVATISTTTRTPGVLPIYHGTLVPGASTYEASDGPRLPDPQRDDHPTWDGAGGEIAIASALNASLDQWRACGWKGQEEPAAIFVSWSRSHLLSDRARAGDVVPAWKPFAKASAQRVAYREDGVFNSSNYGCDVTSTERANLRSEMERQARALDKAHALVHGTVATTTIARTTVGEEQIQREDDVENVKS
jgi:hypothetical protein